MKETDIRKYAELMKELGLTGLEITEDNQVVRLERTAAPEVRQTVPVAVPAAPAHGAAGFFMHPVADGIPPSGQQHTTPSPIAYNPNAGSILPYCQ